MKKLFYQLLYELGRLGAKIVYATFNKLIISTGKYDVQDALAYFHFLHKTITAKPLFNSITFEHKTLYKVFLFLDIHNYGGISLPLAEPPKVVSKADDDADADEPTQNLEDEVSQNGYDQENGETISSNWNVADFLPATLQEMFVLCVSLFIEHINEENEKRGPRLIARAEAAARDSNMLLSAGGGSSTAGENAESELNPNVPMSSYLAGDIHARDTQSGETGTDEDDLWGHSGVDSELTQQILSFIGLLLFLSHTFMDVFTLFSCLQIQQGEQLLFSENLFQLKLPKLLLK